VHQLAPSLCRFVRKLIDERRPSGIVDGLGEHAAGQTLDVQILNRDHPIGLDQGPSDFVLKVSPLVLDLGVRLLEQQDSFAAILAPALAACHTAPSQSQLGLCPLVVARVGDLCAISERRKGGQPDIKPRVGICSGLQS